MRKKIIFLSSFLFFLPFMIFASSSLFSDVTNGAFEKLENGLSVYVFPSNTELVHITFYLRAGEVCASTTKRGLSTVTLHSLINSGSKNFPKEKISSLQKERGIKIEGVVDVDWIRIEITALKNDFDLCLNLLKDLLTNATFDEKRVEMVKEQVKRDILNMGDDPSRKVYKNLFLLLYGSDSPESFQFKSNQINKIDVSDVVSFYKKYYLLQKGLIGVTTSYSNEEMVDKIKRVFSQVAPSKEESCPNPDIDDNESIVLIMQKVGLEKSLVGVGKKLFFPKNRNVVEDYPILEFISVLLYSDAYSARLMKSFFVDRQLSNNIILGFYCSNDPQKGYFVTFLEVPSEKVGFSMYLVGKTFSDLITSPPDEKEIENAKNSIKNKLVEICKDPKALLETNCAYIMRGFPKDYLNFYSERIFNITQKDIIDISKEYFSFKKYQYVIYGSGEKFIKEMDIYGKVVLRNAEIE